MLVTKAIYGSIQSPMLWCKKFVKDVESHGFKLNPCDPCVANKLVDGSNMTIIWLADDAKISHKNKKPIEDFVEWLDAKCGDDKSGRIKPCWGPRHDCLGVILDYSKPGSVMIDMVEYVEKMLSQFEEDTGKKLSEVECPWTDRLFQVDSNSPVLSPSMRDTLHTFVAKGLFLTKRGRPDALPAIAFLTTRVNAPTEQDWKKLVRMLQFLKKTSKDVLTLTAAQLLIVQWFWDAAFAVHPDYKSHTGGALTFGQGVMTGHSNKQKINAKSSTEAEVVAADDGMGPMEWLRLFLQAQGVAVENTVLHQDNQSAMLLEKNGKWSSTKRTRHLNIRYFYITDQLKRGHFKLKYCPTAAMIADYFSKPNTGKLFQAQRATVMNLNPQCEDTGDSS